MAGAMIHDLPLAIEAVRAQSAQDPLAEYEFASSIHRRVAEHVLQGVETHHRAAGFGGKTEGGAAICVAIAQGRSELDGIRLPTFSRPADCTVFVPGYAQQVDSSQKAILKQLGDSPHEPHYLDRARGVLASISVHGKRGTARIHFVSQENANVGMVKGQRRDGLGWMDEPGRRDFWLEARKNHRYLLITETPVKRSEWEWIRDDFTGCIGVVNAGRLELVSRLVDNRFLSAEKVAQLIERLGKGVFGPAFIDGEYVNADGECAFDLHGLQRWLEECSTGRRWQGDPRVELWGDYDPTDPEMILLDPSGGVQGRDKAGLWIIGRRTKIGKGRLFEYVPPHELTKTAVALGRSRGMAMIVAEMNGGWGEAMLAAGLRDYPNLYREQGIDSITGRLSDRIGWYTTETSKGLIRGALTQAIEQNGLRIYSGEAIESLMRIVTDERDRVIRLPRQNHEDFILLGIAAHVLEVLPLPTAQKAADPNEHPFERAFRQDFGRPIRRPIREPVIQENWG